MNESTYSMTPPVSPQRMDFEFPMTEEPQSALTVPSTAESKEIVVGLNSVCFQCCGEVFPSKNIKIYDQGCFHKKGVLKSGELKRFCLGSVHELSDLERGIDMFGYMFTHIALRDEMDSLFYFAREAISEIHSKADQDSANKMQNRQDLVKFLQYVNLFLQSGLPAADKERRKFLQLLSHKIHLLLVFAGRLTDGGLLTGYSLHQRASIHHKCHMHLDLYWNLLQVFHTLTMIASVSDIPIDVKMCQRLPREDLNFTTPFDQLTQIILFDLVNLAVPVFEKLSPQEWLHVSPFSCGCVMEFWTLLVNFLSWKKEKYDTESFWVQLHRVLQTLSDADADNNANDDEEGLDSDVFLLSVTLPSNPLYFCFWLTTHLAHLFAFDNMGNPCSGEPTQSGFFHLQLILERILKSQVREEVLRACLRCCLSVSSLWPVTPEIVTLIWEYMARKLNERFQLQSSSVEGLAMIRKSSSSFLERCQALINIHDNSIEQDSSYYLFLRILARLLQGENASAEWYKIKGRFFSKFHQRRMQELTETGMHNVTCLFLTLAFCVDAQEIAAKLGNLYDLLSASTQLMMQVWCGVLAMTQVLGKLRQDLSFLAERVSHSFCALCKKLSDGKLDYFQRQKLTPLILEYISTVQNIIIYSDIDGAEHIFIGEGINIALRTCGENELRCLLTSLDSIVMHLRTVASKWREKHPCVTELYLPAHKALADNLWLHVFPFACDHARTLTPPLCLADLAVSFTHLALILPPPCSVCSNGIAGVFTQFGASDAVNISITCHYLNQLLGDSMMDSILQLPFQHIATTTTTVSSTVSPTTALRVTPGNSSLYNAVPQAELIKSWFRCVLLILPSSPSLLELTQHLLLLPDVQSILMSGSRRSETDAPATLSWKQFLKCIENCYWNAENLLDRQGVREQVMPYFSSVVHYVVPVLRNMQPLDLLHNVYRIVGCLVKHCAPVLYLQSKPCPLPDIIKSLILPHAVFNTEKPLHPNFFAVVRETLHLFVQGLGRLDYRRFSDVQRQLRDIITVFTLRFPLTTLSDLEKHPILKAVRQPTSIPSAQDVKSFRKFLIGMVLDHLQRSKHAPAEVINLLRAELDVT